MHEYARRCGPLVQVALDYTRMADAVRTASRIVGVGDNVVLEAGTPLVKAYGLESVTILRALPGPGYVVADMKTMDTGRLEVELAAEAGASASTVLSLASDATIVEAVEAAEELGVTLYGDLIDHPDPLGRAVRLEELGVHVVLLHIGIDVQRRLGLTAGSRVEVVKRIRENLGRAVVAVAGGVKPGEVGDLVGAGADIVVIGSAITRASDPRKPLLEALRAAGGGCR